MRSGRWYLAQRWIFHFPFSWCATKPEYALRHAWIWVVLPLGMVMIHVQGLMVLLVLSVMVLFWYWVGWVLIIKRFVGLGSRTFYQNVLVLF
jgi:hypothetical protein